MKRPLTWLLWSPARFWGTTGTLVVVAAVVCAVTILSGLHRAVTAQPTTALVTTPSTATASPMPQQDPVVAAEQLVPERPTGKAFVESGDTSEAVVRVPTTAETYDVTVEHNDATGWTAVAYQPVR